MELADEGGFEAVRLRDVAARAGVALGTLYARFRSKEDILIAVLEQEAGKLEELLEQFPSESELVGERVLYFFGVATQAMFTRPNFGRAVLRAVATGTPDTAGKIARYQARLNGPIIAALRGPKNDGPVPEARHTEIAFLMQNVWFAALVGWMSGIREEAEVMQQMSMATQLILDGVSAQVDAE